MIKVLKVIKDQAVGSGFKHREEYYLREEEVLKKAPWDPNNLSRQQYFPHCPLPSLNSNTSSAMWSQGPLNVMQSFHFLRSSRFSF